MKNKLVRSLLSTLLISVLFHSAAFSMHGGRGRPRFGGRHPGFGDEQVPPAVLVATTATALYLTYKAGKFLYEKYKKKPEGQVNPEGEPKDEVQATSDEQVDGKPKKKKKKKKGKKTDGKPEEATAVKEEVVIQPPSIGLTLIEFKIKYQHFLNPLITAYRKYQFLGKTPEALAQYEETKKGLIAKFKQVHPDDIKKIIEIVEGGTDLNQEKEKSKQ